MDWSKTKNVAKHAVAHGAGWAATLASMQPLVTYPLANTCMVVGAAVGAATCVAGAIAYTTAWMISRQPRTEYHALAAQVVDLAYVHRLGVKWFGKKVSSLERMKQWHAAYPGVIAKVVSERQYGSRRITDLIGYYCALPLSEATAQDILAGRRGITDVGAHELCGPGDVPHTIYIGAIATRIDASGGAALRGLLSTIKLMGKRRQNVQIIARPITADGLALVEKFGLKPVGPAGQSMGTLHSGRLGQLSGYRRQRHQK